MTTRLKRMRPLSSSRSRFSSASTRSPRTVQHRQPVCSSIMSSLDMLDQQVVEADLAELVDDDGGVGERGIVQQAVEQRGLAGAEKAGEHGERDRRNRAARPFRRAHCCLVGFAAPFRVSAVFFGSGFFGSGFLASDFLASGLAASVFFRAAAFGFAAGAAAAAGFDAGFASADAERSGCPVRAARATG